MSVIITQNCIYANSCSPAKEQLQIVASFEEQAETVAAAAPSPKVFQPPRQCSRKSVMILSPRYHQSRLSGLTRKTRHPILASYCTASSFTCPELVEGIRQPHNFSSVWYHLSRDNRFVIYVRKSSEQEERQALSIAAQQRELEEYAAKEQLQIVASFEEARTARETGRTGVGSAEPATVVTPHPRAFSACAESTRSPRQRRASARPDDGTGPPR